MVTVLASSAVDHGFEPRLDQTKDYKIDMCCFSTMQATLADRHVSPLELNILIPSQQVIALLSLVLPAWWRSNTYQFYSLWFDPTEARTHDLQHLRQARVFY
jgi:hypothetical protein